MYMQDSRKDDLGKQAEVVLFRQAQRGDRESLNALMERHDGLVQAVVRRQVLGELPYAEALQAGRIGLWRACMRFDPSRGYAFSTYAWSSIVHHVWRAVKTHMRRVCAKRAGPEEGCCSEWHWVSCVDPARMNMAWLVHGALHDLVAGLPGRLRAIIVARYGLDGQRIELYGEIGERLGVSGERVRQLHGEALVWLRHPPHSHALRSLLSRHRVDDYAWADVEAQGWLRKRGGRHGHG